jgi:predicted chitinase
MARKDRVALLVKEMRRQGVTDKNQMRYMIATARHESNNTVLPVRESYWVRSRLIRKHGQYKGIRRYERFMRRSSISKKYYPYYGMGLVQLTWRENYVKFQKILSHNGFTGDIVKEPELVMNQNISNFILVYGMVHGIFTGKKISDYINGNKVDFVGARRVVNGKDMARKIGRRARREKFEL